MEMDKMMETGKSRQRVKSMEMAIDKEMAVRSMEMAICMEMDTLCLYFFSLRKISMAR